jgi:HD-like signal output (HDOD) protein/prolyl-tRNA editing enzyme YbaK/EbsC (Cys-tRNA(Pro) deacylase)
VTARSILLEDDGGKLLVLVPGDCLLDLPRLRQLTGRTLLPCDPSEIAAFTSKKSLDGIPAIPNISGLTTIIDERLLKAEGPILMDSGKAPHLLEVNPEDLQTLAADKAQSMDIAVPLLNIEQSYKDPSKDESDIIQSVELFTSLRLKQRLEDTLELPPLPSTAQKIIKLRVDPHADISDLSEIVELDPSLAAQVVSWASSPYYSAPGKIRSIHDAIVRVLGYDMVLNLALGIALSRTLAIPEGGAYGSPPYWRSAVYAAATMEGLVTAIPRSSRPGFGLAYLSGLLHNFGFLILAEVFPPHFDNLCNAWDVNNHVDPQVVEKSMIGVNRSQLSAWLMELWHMPEEIIVALRYQSDPTYKGENAIYANLLYIAQQLLRRQGMAAGPVEPIDDELLNRVNIERESLEETMETIMGSVSELENIAQELGG